MMKVIAILVGVAAGTAAIGLIAQQQFGDQADALAKRFGVKAGQGGDILAVVDLVVPGERQAVTQSAIIVAVAGSAVAVLSFVVVDAVLS